jgi:hypothetical protein
MPMPLWQPAAAFAYLVAAFSRFPAESPILACWRAFNTLHSIAYVRGGLCGPLQRPTCMWGFNEKITVAVALGDRQHTPRQLALQPTKIASK